MTPAPFPPAARRVAGHLGPAALTVVTLLIGVSCGGAILDSPAGDAGAQAGTGGAGQSAGGSGAAGSTGAGGAAAGQGGSEPIGCPAGQPANGSPCASAGQTCEYVPSACAACRCQFHCWNGAWVEDGSGCAQPPVPPLDACPADRPRDGTYCLAGPPGGCTYVAAYCKDRASGWTTYDCIGNLWKVGNSTLEPCNAAPPIRDASTD